MKDSQRKAMWSKKKLHNGYTVKGMWEVTDYQLLPDILSEAGIHNEWWNKVLDYDKYRIRKPKWIEIKDSDKNKIARVLIRDDREQYREEQESKNYT